MRRTSVIPRNSRGPHPRAGLYRLSAGGLRQRSQDSRHHPRRHQSAWRERRPVSASSQISTTSPTANRVVGAVRSRPRRRPDRLCNPSEALHDRHQSDHWPHLELPGQGDDQVQRSRTACWTVAGPESERPESAAISTATPGVLGHSFDPEGLVDRSADRSLPRRRRIRAVAVRVRSQGPARYGSSRCRPTSSRRSAAT